MKKYFFWLVVRLLCAVSIGLVGVAPVMAQTVGAIGVGDVGFAPTVDVDAQAEQNVVAAITSRLNEALTKTRKFNVLPYSELTQKLQKQGLSLDGFYNKTYAGSDFHQAGLDYILTTKVTEFGLFKKSATDPENAIGLIDLEFTLHGVADRAVDFSSSISSQVSKRTASASDGSASNILDQAIQKGVDDLVAKMVAAVFPLSVIRIDELGNIMLNYGDGLLAQGDTVLVYPSGKAVPMDAIKNDDNTGASPIATLQIMSTDTRFSIAQALNGTDQLVRGQKGKLLASGN
ncbi:hypothetical protein [Arenicella xantha]|uniref:Curli production assembly/transport component CsgG n=1 Tax=Arenicella xantha TaxID=644221 RepID=A0A395JRZ6_9GAMM|nr:hypothetical protein [Arenicella xantha]RBP53355.1 hypothetical protein DFR28_101741 [Arenicella xantha]